MLYLNLSPFLSVNHKFWLVLRLSMSDYDVETYSDVFIHIFVDNFIFGY